jgi:TP901 family phage tail tape measure protein
VAAQDLLVRIDATTAGFSAALAKAEMSTYKFETSLQGLNASILQLERELATIGPRAMAAAAAMAKAQMEMVAATTKKIGSAFGVVGAAAGLAFFEVEKATANLDSRLAVVNSLVRSTGKEMSGLRQAAMTAGDGIAVSASGAADAEIELAKAGIAAADIYGGALRGALTLAAAGQADITDATTVAAAAMSEFALKGEDVPHIADLIAAGADRSLGSVTDLGYALAQAGTTAHQAGISLEDTTGALAAFAAAGLIGERGGTTLKQVLLQLEAPTDKAQALMDQFGFSLYKANGQMKTLPELAGALNKSFGDLAPKIRNNALATMFGSRAVQGANILMAQGVVGMNVWNAKVNDQGFAAYQAAQKLDSLTGDLEKFQATLSTTFAGAGEGAVAPLREIVQLAEDGVKVFADLPGPIKSTVVEMLGLAAAVGLTGFAYSRAAPAIAEFKVQLAETSAVAGMSAGKMIAMRGAAAGVGALFLGIGAAAGDSNKAIGVLANTAAGAAFGFSVGGPWGAAIGAGIGGLLGLEGAFHDSAGAARQAALENADYSATLNDVNANITQVTKSSIAQTLQQGGVLEATKSLGLSTGDLVNAIAGVPGATTKVRAELAALTAQYGTNEAALVLQYQAYVRNSQGLGQNIKSYSEWATAYRVANEDVVKNIGIVSDALGSQKAKLADDIKAKKDEIQATREARQAAYEHGQAVRGDGDAIAFHTSTLVINTKWLAKDIELQHKLADLLLAQRHDRYALAAATKEASDQLAGITGTLDKNTAAGQRNEQILEDYIGTWQSLRTSAQEVPGAYEETRKTLIKLIMAMGKSRESAEAMATKFLDVPNIVRTARLETRQAEEDARILGVDLDKLKGPDLTAKVETLDAVRNVADLGRFIEKTLGLIPNETVNIDLSAQANKVANTLARFGGSFATGGSVSGGIPGRDSVHGLLMPGERVATTAVVTKAGGGSNQRGQQVMGAIEKMILRGQMGKLGDVPYAAGGEVTAINPAVSQSGLGAAVAQTTDAIDNVVTGLGGALSKELNKLLTQLSFGGGTPLGWASSLTPAGVVRGQEFASSQAGKPYGWGAVGPNSYDCSGFQSAVLNAAHGAYPYSRLGSTGTMPWGGSAPGVGMYTIGWSTNVGGSGIGHTSGNIGGLGVESNGSNGVVVGSGALSPLDSMFNGLMHYDGGGTLRPGYTLAHNGTGFDEQVLRMAGGGAVLQGGVQVGSGHGGGHDAPIDPAVALAQAIKEAFKHFWFGPKATGDKTASEVHDLVKALREALGKDSPLLEHVKNLGDKLIQAAKAQDRMSAHLDNLIAKRDAYSHEVAGTFRNDLFGMGSEGLLTQLKADRNDARRMHQALRKAKAKGLSGGLFKELAASGDYGTAQELANMSRAQIHRYEVLYNQRQKATRTLGDYAGQQVFGQDIHGIRRELGHLNHQIRNLHQAINHIGPHVEHGARRGTHDGARDGMREQGRRAAHGIR